MKQKIFIVLVFFWGMHCSYARPVLPHYQDVLNAQFACSNQQLHEISLDPDREHHIATKTLSVIDDLSIKEISYNAKKGDSRTFELVFRGYAYFECGKKAKGLETPMGKVIQDFPVILRAWKKPMLIDIQDYNHELLPDQNVEGWKLFTSNMRSTDQIVSNDEIGLTCLVRKSTLIKHPDRIDYTKLCKGASQQEIDFTKQEVKKALQVWNP